jgi:hypothetical protein
MRGTASTLNRYLAREVLAAVGVILLGFLVWDSDAEAEEFAAAYRNLLELKYPGGEESVFIERRGNEVLIVEGGEPARIDDYIDIVARAEKSP